MASLAREESWRWGLSAGRGCGVDGSNLLRRGGRDTAPVFLTKALTVRGSRNWLGCGATVSKGSPLLPVPTLGCTAVVVDDRDRLMSQEKSVGCGISRGGVESETCFVWMAECRMKGVSNVGKCLRHVRGCGGCDGCLIFCKGRLRWWYPCL